MSILSSAEARRPIAAAAALRAFASGGYHGTTIADVAGEAKISPAYVSKLYATKERLFVAALEECFDRIVEALAAGADSAPAGADGDTILDAMGLAYARLIADRDLMMLQVHAQSIADIPDVGAALRSGLGRVTRLAKERSKAGDDAVQRFIAYGQLCHLIVTARLADSSESWVPVVTRGFRHF